MHNHNFRSNFLITNSAIKFDFHKQFRYIVRYPRYL
nr:MAG TPA: hypothetical protein [Bacteriophage sp.]